MTQGMNATFSVFNITAYAKIDILQKNIKTNSTVGSRI